MLALIIQVQGCTKATGGNINKMWWLKKVRVKPDYSVRDKHQRFYSSTGWQRLRLYKLSISPLCELCLPLLVPADVVDHDVSLTDDYSLRLVLSNLQSLCPVCHNKKSSHERWRYHQERQKEKIDDRMDELNDF